MSLTTALIIWVILAVALDFTIYLETKDSPFWNRPRLFWAKASLILTLVEVRYEFRMWRLRRAGRRAPCYENLADITLIVDGLPDTQEAFSIMLAHATQCPPCMSRYLVTASRKYSLPQGAA